MALVSAYSSPGVTVTESNNPALAAILAAPNGIAILGDGQGFQSATEAVELVGTSYTALNNPGVVESSISIINVTQGYAAVTSGTFLVDSTDPDPTIDGNEVYSIRRIVPPTVPTSSGSVSGDLNGTYEYVVTFMTSRGETGHSPALSVTGNNKWFQVGIPINTDATVTATSRKIYRRKVDASGILGTFRYVGTAPDNLNYTFTDSVTDTAITTTPTSYPAAPNGIDSGDNLRVTYNYTDKNYYEPTIFNNFSDAVAKYGDPFNATTGEISSELTFAIRMAFLNGATEVIGVARKGDDVNYVSALEKLLDIEEIAFVAVASGNEDDHDAVVAHCRSAEQYGLYRQCILGLDGTVDSYTIQDLRTKAKAYGADADIAEKVMLVSPASFNILNPVTLKQYAVGAQYAASALLGMFASRDAVVPLTRKLVAGFSTPNETRTIQTAAGDSNAGLCLIEYKGGNFRVRHSVTTAITDSNKREASVVRAKYALAYEVKNGLEGLIGLTASQDEIPLIVDARLTNILSQLVGGGLISSYANVSSRVIDNPTTVECRFEYTPIYPLNNINVVFTINTQSGGFALTQI